MSSYNNDSGHRRESNAEDTKSTVLSVRFKRFLSNSRTSPNDSPKYQGLLSSEAQEDGDQSGNEEIWVDLPNSGRGNINENATSNARNVVSVGDLEGSPPKYAEYSQNLNDQGELKLEDLKWLHPSEQIDSPSSKPRTPPYISLADDRYPLDGESSEQYPLLFQENDSSRIQTNSASKNPPSGSNPLIELQMDPVQKKRNIDFHINFPSIPLDDILIEDWHCALHKEILVTGRLFVTQERICFHSNLFGWVNHTMIPFSDIVLLQKRSTAFVIPNAIQIVTLDQKFFFTSFISRDSAFTLLYELWSKKCPNRANDPAKLLPSTSDSKNEAPSDELSAESGINTLCSCLKTSSHEGVVNIDTIYPMTVDSLFELLFGAESTFIKEFLSESNQDIDIGAWKDDLRNINYIKPLSMPIGPKQTRCVITERILNRDFEDHCIVEVRNQNPDVPSGDAFTVVSRNCISISRTNQCRLITSTSIEWSKSSWFKGPIETGAKEGTTKSAQDLDAKIRQYLKDHPDLVTKPVGDDQPETVCEVQSCSDKELQETPASSNDLLSQWGVTPNIRNIMLIVLVSLFAIFIANRWRISRLQSQLESIKTYPHDPTIPQLSPHKKNRLQELQNNLRQLQSNLRELQANLHGLSGQLEAYENDL